MGRWDRASRVAEVINTEPAPDVPGADQISKPVESVPTSGVSSASGTSVDKVSFARSWRSRGQRDQNGASRATDQEQATALEAPVSPMQPGSQSSTRASPCVNDVPALTVEGAARPGLGCTVKLRRGVKMPQMGLGGGMSPGTESREAIAAALLMGYRLIDTAVSYGTEQDIAAAIRSVGLKRNDVFISTKLLQKSHKSEQEVRASLMLSLKNLGTDYVDLYLIHNPRAGRILQVWPVLLEMRDQGLIRTLGVSNFGVGQLEGIHQAGFEMPEVNQIEIHPWRQLPEVVEYHKKHSIATMCMAPLARCQMFGQTGLSKIAKEIGRTEAEVAIRWSLQQGYIPIPKSSHSDRIELNAATGFDLSHKHVDKIAKLDCGFMSCRGSSPCCELAWKLVANKIPDQSTLAQNKNSVLKGQGRGAGGYGQSDYSNEL